MEVDVAVDVAVAVVEVWERRDTKSYEVRSIRLTTAFTDRSPNVRYSMVRVSFAGGTFTRKSWHPFRGALDLDIFFAFYSDFYSDFLVCYFVFIDHSEAEMRSHNFRG